METIEIKLGNRKKFMVVKELNEVLDNNEIFSKNWTKEVIIQLIISNFTKDETIKLIEEIESIPISEWN